MIGITPPSTLLTAQRMHAAHSRSLVRSFERLATGQRINRGSDDPAGLITSENLRAVLAALEAETRSLDRSSHVANVADGALGQVSDLLVEARGLLVASANSAGMSDAEREANQMQLDSILATVNRISGQTSFNGQSLLNGSATITAGEDSLDLDSISTGNLGEVEIDGETYSLADLGAGGRLSLRDGDLEAAQQVLSAAISQVATQRGQVGAFQRYTIESRIESNRTTMENTAAANSQIRDTDYAAETANLARLQVLERASLEVMLIGRRNHERVLSLLAR